MDDKTPPADFRAEDHTQLFDFPAEPEGIFYLAYCVNEGRAITGWTSDLSQIVNAEYYHRRSNGGHLIRVYQRVT